MREDEKEEEEEEDSDVLADQTSANQHLLESLAKQPPARFISLTCCKVVCGGKKGADAFRKS